MSHLAASSKLHAVRFRAHSVLPGFNLALGFTLLYLSLIVLIPLSALFFKTATLGLGGFWDVVTNDRVLASLRVTFVTSFAAAVINALFGLIVAWVLVRSTFPGKRIVDALVDLPFALPTAVAGITLATLYKDFHYSSYPRQYSKTDLIGIPYVETKRRFNAAFIFNAALVVGSRYLSRQHLKQNRMPFRQVDFAHLSRQATFIHRVYLIEEDAR